MAKLFIVVILIIVLAYFIGKNKTKTSCTKEDKSKQTTNTPQSKEQNQIPDKYLYKKIGIKECNMKGMFYQNLKPNIHSGIFYGFAKCEQTSHDQYAVGIYNFDNELLGYAPKGNKRLHNSIHAWNNRIAPAWGSLRYNDYKDEWYGHAEIAIGFNNEKTKQIECFLRLKNKNEELIRKQEKSTEKYFEILNNHSEIKTILSSLKEIVKLGYSFQTNLLPSISSHLEKEKNWKKLIELEKHTDLISELSEKFKQTTLRRIDKAKNIVENNNM
ncbi:hypothetical protein [uncultured Winogradskyella sp.]|uniref:hypothetical protein n=1 Tax=uncultured Winogradskyella sp. TaxID=395353 RepID=UPI0030DB8221|tara:strand:- start:25276 stop:26091 length:816 start_codon:yes stop_codon:yes gene_type:complete